MDSGSDEWHEGRKILGAGVGKFKKALATADGLLSPGRKGSRRKGGDAGTRGSNGTGVGLQWTLMVYNQ